ncbi:3-methyladenine DNA glycosylase [Cyclonatronum proteinivorum]|nr:3-methyladenine DNA glycosylase [Cyclonatronum proteinivorum]
MIIQLKNLSRKKWLAQAASHREAVEQLTGGYLQAKSRQAQNPVMDFMFTYYKFRPSKLMQWTPGFGVMLEGATEADGFDDRFFSVTDEGAFLDLNRFPAKKQRGLRWITELLRATASRPPNFGCCGMHEWAMVYEAEDVRHGDFPLRLSPGEIRVLVDNSPVNCSHFDAFRFFTPSARPKNSVQLTRDNMHDYEQPGCLHTNMDLYKWCYKLTPWVPSSLTLQAFRLACEARTLDMQAGPYDLRAIGYSPVCIETEAGRRIYKKRQAELYSKSQPLRDALISVLTQLHDELYHAQHAPEAVL